jgi:hypothetical protein
MAVTVDYYLSIYARGGMTTDNPAGLFRCVHGAKWMTAHYVKNGKWHPSDCLANEMISARAVLEPIPFAEAMRVMRTWGGKPDDIDLATSQSEDPASVERSRPPVAAARGRA